MRPIVEVMTVNFSLLALDQIVNTAAALRHMSGGQFSVPLVVRMATGAGRQLAAQHSHSLECWYAHIPGIKVVAPATVEDAYGMLGTALADPDPVVIFEHVQLYNATADVEMLGPTDISRAAIRRAGADVTVITYGGCLPKVLDAADELSLGGIDCEVVDLRSLRPLDTETFVDVGPQDPSRGRRRRGLAHGQSRGARSARRSSRTRSTTSMPRSRGCAAPRCRCPTPSTWRRRRCRSRDDDRRRGAEPVRGRSSMIEFTMPALGADMDEGTLNEWLVKPGDPVRRGQIVAVVETTKAAVEIECWHDGTVQRAASAGRSDRVGGNAVGDLAGSR